MLIEARAPTRIDLAGGTLDIWPLYLFHDGAITVNCAITRYASCSLQPLAGKKEIAIDSQDTQQRQSFPSLAALCSARKHRLPLLSQLIKYFKPLSGIRLRTNSEAPAGAGIGGSSAMAVAVCAALDQLLHSNLTRVDWVHISRDVESMVIGVPTGTQDHYPAAFGGPCVVSYKPGGESCAPLRVNPSELERRLALCYTGKPRQSAVNNWKVFQQHLDGNARVRRNLEEIAVIARHMREALEKNQWEEAGHLLCKEWEFRRRNLPTISTPAIDRIIAAARRKGALGGKVCGAGGGGCVAFFIQPDAREAVHAAVQSAGGQVLPMQIDRRGAHVRVSDRP